ncbi:hypothetical protein HD596_007864 [Nonomuraea jabiensis]|uniref:Uncharacterized protein n=1 Tax=Nonomuraea jabiensis TaxID=882448 RepID=A0A7W9LEW1_9ACTN|nr:hypothetical protein [Nonomuraea jabiensis]
MARRSRKTGHWRTRHDEGHALRLELGDLARAAAEPGWARLEVRRAQVGPYARTTLTRDGREIAAEGLDEPFQRLRELSYKADSGTWFTCELTLSSGSRGYTCRVDSSVAPFEDVPAPAALAELTTFPRTEPPGWLLAALPTAAPIGMPTTYGAHHDWWGDDRSDRRPPPPIHGDVAYVPAAGMTCRDFGHSDEHRQRAVFLAESAGDDESEHLYVMSYEEVYMVARHGFRGTDAGMRSITLDGAALRFELTPEAADALGTETTFEARLELPPETIAELRTALRAVLGPVAQAPELIGF